MADLQGKKIGEGQEAEIFLIENDKVVKLFKSDSYAEKSRRESELLSLLNANKVSAPMMHGQITMDAKPGYVMDYIPGYSLLAKLEANPLQCNKIARQFADIHVKVSGTKAPDELGEEIHSIKWCVEQSNVPQEYIDYGLRVLSSLPKGNDLCHGDYNLANVLINMDNEPVLIDWGGAGKGHYVSDVANATLMIMNSELPPDASRMTRNLIVFLRRIFEKQYLNRYKRLRSFSEKELHDWQVVRAIARMAYCVEGEKRNLLAFIDKCYKNPSRTFIF